MGYLKKQAAFAGLLGTAASDRESVLGKLGVGIGTGVGAKLGGTAGSMAFLKLMEKLNKTGNKSLGPALFLSALLGHAGGGLATHALLDK